MIPGLFWVRLGVATVRFRCVQSFRPHITKLSVVSVSETELECV